MLELRFVPIPYNVNAQICEMIHLLPKSLLLVQFTHLYATGLMLSVSRIILISTQRNNGGVPGVVKCVMTSFSLVIVVQLRYSSSTHFFSTCLFSFGMGFCVKNVLRIGGKHCNVWDAHECGVCCIIDESNSLHHAFDWSSTPEPVMCIEWATVKMSARFNSSLSVDTTLPGIFESVKYRESCGCTSAEPMPVIKRNAVDSTHKWIWVWFVCGTDANECKWLRNWTR